MGATSSEETGVLVVRLVEVLKGHLKGHRRLLQAMEKRRKARAEGDVEVVEQALAEERVAVEAIALGDEERATATARVAKALGFAPGRRMRLLDLIQLVGEEHRDELLDLRDELREVADALDGLNHLSRTLVLHSEERANLFLVLLEGQEPGSGVEAGEEGEGWEDGEDWEEDPLLLNRRI